MFAVKRGHFLANPKRKLDLKRFQRGKAVVDR